MRSSSPPSGGEPAGSLVVGGLYLVLTAGWALLRRRGGAGALGRRGLGAVLGIGVVVALAGGAVAGPAGPVAVPSPAPSTAEEPAPRASASGREPVTTEPPSPSPEPATTPEQTPEAGAPAAALAAARELEVKGRAPRTGYARDLFGSGWVDTDRNGCDTRNDILARDLTDLTYRPGTHDCVVTSGTLADPFSGETIAFVRGNDTSTAVQVDHVVALSDAWQKGAQQWDTDTRVRFANDPLNLLAVDGPLNAQKGDGDTATWLPPDRSFRCAYVARQVGVKHAYGLWVTQAEQDAMVRVLGDCPQEPLPTGDAASAVTSPVPGTPTAPDDDVSYASCSAAREAGAAPVHAGDPGYGRHLDRDGDGVGCE
ncbi:Excalibur calcium-binding domain-containing protein [Georgenia satyanarayanai]|uniref:Excalibur calcium-binding domain-containing protein n=1 Tax=Georgenia satyanarayanai TaxID=860221 RepID=A0A2Y9BVB9_9MICO|nr:DUF1524 domain-containing protein [Georgenia satyanarayanai]PYG02232.1 excalibur calcium-binding domain-containing protein [Georgenia satyanarayanai]SSA37072.1 Excalibur calcium-binding domain-containing protein [Georgenia satyanarayanai]